MHRTRLVITTVAATLLAVPAVVLANPTADDSEAGRRAELSRYPVTVTVSQPASGSTVGRSVTFSGTAKPDISLALDIDGVQYLDPRDRPMGDTGREYIPAAVSDANGRFTFTADLSGNSVLIDSNGNRKPLTAGPHTFLLSELYSPVSGKSPDIRLTVQDAAAPARAEQPAATVTPSASPSAVPTAVAASDTKVESATHIEPWLAALLAAVGGALIVLLAHRFSPHRTTGSKR